MHSPAIVQLSILLREMESTILATPPSDWSQFREMVGRYRGLREALDILEKEARGTLDVEDSDEIKFE